MTGTGLCLLLLSLHAGGLRIALGWIVASLMLVGLGNGLVLPSLIGIALTHVRPEQAGIGSAVLSTAQQFAGAAGVAVIGTIFFEAAGPAQDHLRAMEVSALINLALVAVVTLLLGRLARAATEST